MCNARTDVESHVVTVWHLFTITYYEGTNIVVGKLAVRLRQPGNDLMALYLPRISPPGSAVSRVIAFGTNRFSAATSTAATTFDAVWYRIRAWHALH